MLDLRTTHNERPDLESETGFDANIRTTAHSATCGGVNQELFDRKMSGCIGEASMRKDDYRRVRSAVGVAHTLSTLLWDFVYPTGLHVCWAG